MVVRQAQRSASRECIKGQIVDRLVQVTKVLGDHRTLPAFKRGADTKEISARGHRRDGEG